MMASSHEPAGPLSPWMTVDSQLTHTDVSRQTSVSPPPRLSSPPPHVPHNSSFVDDTVQLCSLPPPVPRKSRSCLAPTSQFPSMGPNHMSRCATLALSPPVVSRQNSLSSQGSSSSSRCLVARRESLIMAPRGSISVYHLQDSAPHPPVRYFSDGSLDASGLPALIRGASAWFNPSKGTPSPGITPTKATYIKDSDDGCWASVMPHSPSALSVPNPITAKRDTSMETCKRSEPERPSKNSPRADALHRLRRSSTHFWPPQGVQQEEDKGSPMPTRDQGPCIVPLDDSFNLGTPPHGPHSMASPSFITAALPDSWMYLIASGLLALVSLFWIWLCNLQLLSIYVFLAIYCIVVGLGIVDMLLLGLEFGWAYYFKMWFLLDLLTVGAMALDAWLVTRPDRAQLWAWLWCLTVAKVLTQSRRLLGGISLLLHCLSPTHFPYPWRTSLLRRLSPGDRLHCDTLRTIIMVAAVAALLPLVTESIWLTLTFDSSDRSAVAFAHLLLAASSPSLIGESWTNDAGLQVVKAFFGPALQYVRVGDDILFDASSQRQPLSMTCVADAATKVCIDTSRQAYIWVICQAVAVLLLLLLLVVVYQTLTCKFAAFSLAPLQNTLQVFQADTFQDIYIKDISQTSSMDHLMSTFDIQLVSLQDQLTKLLEQEVILRTGDKLSLVARETAQAKNDFLMAMSHELRTPVAEMIGYAELLQQTALSEFQRDLLKNIMQSGETSLERVGDVLEFSQLVDHSIQLDMEPFCLRAVFEGALKDMQLKLAKNRITATLHMDPELPRVVIGDAGQVRQMVLNLLKNAVQYTPTDGDITIVVKKFAFDELSPEQQSKPSMQLLEAEPTSYGQRRGSSGARSVGRRQSSPVSPTHRTFKRQLPSDPSLWSVKDTGYQGRQSFQMDMLQLYVEVIDSGIGIPLEQQEHVLEPFVQVDQSATRQHGGLGLGLSTCKHLVEAMGGAIAIESPVQQPPHQSTCPGTKVYFVIRLAYETSQPTEKQSVESSAFEGLLVMLLISNPRTRSHVTSLLDMANVRYQIVQATGLEHLQHKALFLGLVVDTDDLSALPATEMLCEMDTAGAILGLGWQLEDTPPLFQVSSSKPLSSTALFDWMKTLIRGCPSPGQSAWERRFSSASASPNSGPRVSAGQMQILMAEDTPSLQKLIGIQLSRLGLKVQICNHGAEVLRQLRQQWYPVVLLDYHMPVMDGVTCAEEIRRLEQEGAFGSQPPIQIIAMTADVLSVTKAKCLQAGMNIYLEKPVSMLTLKSVLGKFFPLS